MEIASVHYIERYILLLHISIQREKERCGHIQNTKKGKI